MPGTVLNKLRLQKFIIDVAIFFIPRTERERARESASREGDWERQTETHRTETGESPSRGGRVDRLRRRPRSGLRLQTPRSERGEKKGRGRDCDGGMGGKAGPEVLNIFFFFLVTRRDQGPRLGPSQPRWKAPGLGFIAPTLGWGWPQSQTSTNPDTKPRRSRARAAGA